MSKTQKVGTVLLAVPLYEVDGQPTCHRCPSFAPITLTCEALRDAVPQFCNHVHPAKARELEAPYTDDECDLVPTVYEPHRFCPLRADDALTVAEVVQYGYGYPQVMHHINSQGQEACSGCYGTNGKHADTCCALAAQRWHISTHNKLMRLAGEVG